MDRFIAQGYPKISVKVALFEMNPLLVRIKSRPCPSRAANASWQGRGHDLAWRQDKAGDESVAQGQTWDDTGIPGRLR